VAPACKCQAAARCHGRQSMPQVLPIEAASSSHAPTQKLTQEPGTRFEEEPQGPPYTLFRGTGGCTYSTLLRGRALLFTRCSQGNGTPAGNYAPHAAAARRLSQPFFQPRQLVLRRAQSRHGEIAEGKRRHVHDTAHPHRRSEPSARSKFRSAERDTDSCADRSYAATLRTMNLSVPIGDQRVPREAVLAQAEWLLGTPFTSPKGR